MKSVCAGYSSGTFELYSLLGKDDCYIVVIELWWHVVKFDGKCDHDDLSVTIIFLIADYFLHVVIKTIFRYIFIKVVVKNNKCVESFRIIRNYKSPNLFVFYGVFFISLLHGAFSIFCRVFFILTQKNCKYIAIVLLTSR